jgi:ornithine cyclodeaminase/alanine dehydrogenase-like protein (mu-crystallin family)
VHYGLGRDVQDHFKGPSDPSTKTGNIEARQEGAMFIMSAYLAEESKRAIIGGKIFTVFPENSSMPYDPHQGCILLFEAQNGGLLAIVDSKTVTAIRTAAASAVATKILAREEAANLAILGSGSLATSHLAAMKEVRNITNVKVWSPNKEHAERFVKIESDRSEQVVIEIAASVENAVKGADIVCTTTRARNPIVNGDWIPSGCHINAVGAAGPSFRELDSKVLVISKLYTDRRESLVNEADDFLIPLKEGLIGESHLVGATWRSPAGQDSGQRR